MFTATATSVSPRRILETSRGSSHGMITRLISPHHLGEVLKPFVFLDLFDDGGEPFTGFGLHPHSGIATLTYIAQGSVSFEDTNGARGLLNAGSSEWMRAGKGIWHGGGAGKREHSRGYQLWLALPPNLELGPSQSMYQGPADIPQIGPAKVLLGAYEGISNAVPPPSSINYLAVTLKAGESWTYAPPEDQTLLWIALGKGQVRSPEIIDQGEIAIFAQGSERVDFVALADSEFVLGSAAPHEHDLVTGHYSVHTSAEALAAGEARIREIHRDLRQQRRI